MPTSSNFEVFSFNTSKSPEKHSDDILFSHTVSIKQYVAGLSSTDFIDNIKSILSAKTPQSLIDARAEIESFAASESYLNSKDSINREVNNILVLYNELILLEDLTDDMRSLIMDGLGISEIEVIVTDPFIANWVRLWNNLIAELVKPTSMDLRDGLVKAIQAMKIVKCVYDNSISNIGVLKRFLKSVPIIPLGILPIHFESENESSSSVDSQRDYLLGLLTEIQDFKIALNELIQNQSKYRGASQEVQNSITWEFDDEGQLVTNPIDQPQPIDFLNLTNDRVDELSQATKDILEGLGFTTEAGRTYQLVLNDINNKIENKVKEVYKPNYAAKKGVLEGGVMFGIDEFEVQPDNSGELTPEPFPGWLEPCRVKPIGISDYRKVEAIWKRYEAGEIAHIENILEGETKERDTRHLRRSEETYTIETIKEKEVIRDLQTTERFALQKEASKIVQQDFDAKVDAYVKGSYGTVSFGVSGGISFSQSTTNSQMEASQYAKDVIDRSVNRILERTREERTIKILEEYEEKNLHSLSSPAGNGHIVGVYRWVDKIMQCKLANYGKRLLFEFMVPEPAAFHIFAKARKSLKGVFVEKPIHPKLGITNPITNSVIKLNCPQDLDINNYKVWASAYNAKVEPYPMSVDIGKAFTDSLGVIPPGQWLSKTGASNDLKLPDGYVSDWGEIRYMNESAFGHSIGVAVGDVHISSWSYGNGVGFTTFILDNFTDTVPVSWYFNSPSCAAFNLIIHCKPSDTKIAEWQLKTFETIMDAYSKMLDDFNNAVSEAQVSQGIIIEGNNPLINRETEKIELKKSCIQLMTSNDFFYQFNAMNHDLENNPLYDNYPYFDNCEAIAEGHIVKFIESIMDWDIMSYFFHPYFWANRSRWVEIYNTSSIDPLHTSFLQAGFARVVVPVRLGFEYIAMQFVETGIVNYNPDTWVVATQEAVDAKIELEQNSLATNIPDPILDPIGYATWEASELNPANWSTWEVRVPTNLVILQEECPVASDTALPVNPNV